MRFTSTIALLCLLVAPLARLDAQNNTASLWGGAGVGVSTAGLGLLLDFNHAESGRIWRGRFSAHNNLGGGLNLEAKQASVMELSFLYGKGAPVLAGNYGAITAGAGWVTGSRDRAGGTAEKVNTVGLAVGVQMLSWRTPHLSLEALGNLNPKMSFAGVTISILLGSMPWIVR
ncbi:MAG: hypothetical protein JWO05_1463 [Gemmatimonadetes bacterium]|nr:hypothetical protein [Gemmatimonadota bacterium]